MNTLFSDYERDILVIAGLILSIVQLIHALAPKRNGSTKYQAITGVSNRPREFSSNIFSHLGEDSLFGDAIYRKWFFRVFIIAILISLSGAYASISYNKLYKPDSAFDFYGITLVFVQIAGCLATMTQFYIFIFFYIEVIVPILSEKSIWFKKFTGVGEGMLAGWFLLLIVLILALKIMPSSDDATSSVPKGILFMYSASALAFSAVSLASLTFWGVFSAIFGDDM